MTAPQSIPLAIALTAHPVCSVPADWRVTVELVPAKNAHTLTLRYRLPATGVRLPSLVEPRRADDLWKNTCAELFVAQSEKAEYREFNFSPSGEWAAYDFVSYRQRSDVLPKLPPPDIALIVTGDSVMLTVTLALDCLPSPNLLTLCFSTTVVLQADDGVLSYWAVSHADSPDFHQRNSFIVPLVAGRSHS